MKFIIMCATHSLLHTGFRYHFWFPQLFPLLAKLTFTHLFKKFPKFSMEPNHSLMFPKQSATFLCPEPNTRRASPQTPPLKIYLKLYTYVLQMVSFIWDFLDHNSVPYSNFFRAYYTTCLSPPPSRTYRNIFERSRGKMSNNKKQRAT